MSTRALSEEEGTDTRTGALSEEGEQTGSQLRLPDGHLGTFETKQGACVDDREQPGRYISRQAFEIGDHANRRR